ncbi:MAG: hypothetical protein JWQ27_3080 [Ferruginibacter sp.]|nr:hypothetical protein [Ferruginibacter sp.]
MLFGNSAETLFMKRLKFLTPVFALAFLFGCETIQKATNSTGTAFSLNGQWELVSNSPENTLIGSRVTVSPFIAEGRFSILANNTQCYRETDVKWKSIATDNAGGFTLDNLLSNCAGAAPTYQRATATIAAANEVRISGKNIQGQDNVQIWRKVTQ